MPPEIVALLANPVTYVVVIVIGWLGKLGIERWLSRRISQGFDERLETHKHGLQLVTEQARFEYQRDLANFNLIAERRHLAAESIFAKVRIADGAVGGLFGLRRQPTFEELSRDDMEGYLIEREFPEGMRETILEEWDTDREAALAQLKPRLRLLEVHEAEARFNEARNEVFLNELYLSKAATEALDTFFGMLWDWLFVAQNPGQGQRWKFSAQQISEARDVVRDELRAELRVGEARQLAAPRDPEPALPSGTHGGPGACDSRTLT